MKKYPQIILLYLIYYNINLKLRSEQTRCIPLFSSRYHYYQFNATEIAQSSLCYLRFAPGPKANEDLRKFSTSLGDAAKVRSLTCIRGARFSMSLSRWDVERDYKIVIKFILLINLHDFPS